MIFNFSNDNGHLAKTRKEQFGYIMRNNISTLFLFNVLTFIFLLPLLFVLIGSLIVFRNLSISESVSSNQLFSCFLICGLLVIPAYILFSLGLAGLYNGIKRLVFYSTAKISDYFNGIKVNFKPFFINSLLFGLMSGLLIINIGVYFYINIDASIKLIVLIINIFFFLTLLIGKGFTNFEMTTFNNESLVYIRNGIYLFYKILPLSLIELILIIAPILFIGFLPVEYIFIPLGLLATCYLSISALAIFLICISSYEKMFSKEELKEIYHKGLEDINL